LKNPLIATHVPGFDDADIEMTVKGAIASKYRNAARPASAPTASWRRTGSMTPSPKRLAETAGAMKVADGFEPGAVIGPLIDMKAVERSRRPSPAALKKGAEVVAAGKRAAHQYEAGAVPSSSRQSSPM
jgi:succinate-semialdehyde dehydrogenase/glutarate-semialdehyde dehydrogenase